MKAEAFKAKGVQLAVDLDLLLPSPNQAELSGSDSFAMVPRVIAGFVFLEWLRLYADAGYDYDFKVEELRRFSWDAGFSIPHRVAVVDVGFSGSVYQQAVRWTPTVAPIPDVSDPSIIFGDFVKLPKQDNELGTTYVNALVGLKVKIWRTLQLGGAVVVPVDASEFRPDALGTLAIEAAF